MPEVKKERTGWRDRALSERHRKWGWNCPAIDLDFLEYNKGQPIALVECKHERAAPQQISHPSYQALIRLGDKAAVPVFAVRYKADFSLWCVVPLNNEAKKHLAKRTEMNEREWVTLLYKMRDRELPQDLFDGDALRA